MTDTLPDTRPDTWNDIIAVNNAMVDRHERGGPLVGYDMVNDVIHISRYDGPRENVVTLEPFPGFMLRLVENPAVVVGVTIIDARKKWRDRIEEIVDAVIEFMDVNGSRERLTDDLKLAWKEDG